MDDVGQSDQRQPDTYLEFAECAGCGELFPIRSRFGRKAKWCSEWCRKQQYQRPCAVCGKPCGGSDKSTYCSDCGQVHAQEVKAARRDEREAQVIALRAEGLLNYEIAERLGMTTPAVSNLVCRARHRGLEVTPAPIAGAAAHQMGRKIVRRSADA